MSSRMGETLNLALALEGRVKPARSNEQLVVIAEALAELPDPRIDTSFMLALEARILTEDLAEQQPARRLEAVPAVAPAPVAEPIRRAPVVQMPKRRFVVRRSLVAVAACMSLMAFGLVAAASSLPGSPLYGAKRFVEHVMGTDLGSQLQLRMAEFERLSVIDPASQQLVPLAAEIEGLLAQLRALVADTTDPATLREIGGWARTAELQLRAFVSNVAPSIAQQLDGALIASLDIQDAVKTALGITTRVVPPVSRLWGADGDQGSQSGSSSQGRARSSDGSGKHAGGGRTTDKAKDTVDDAGDTAGHYMSDVAEGCEVPLSTEAGDLFAPVAKVMCAG